MGIEDFGLHKLISHSIEAALPIILPATFADTNDKIVEIISLIFNNKPLRIVFYFYQIKFSKWTIIPLTGNIKNMGAKLRIFWIGQQKVPMGE